MKTRLRNALLGLLMILVAACAAAPGGSTRKRADAMQEYAAAVRWNDFDAAWAFIDPAVRLARPLDDADRERLRLVQVTGYDVRNQTLAPDGLTLDQVVELRIVNKTDQVERTITDHQRWIFDAATKRWWLVSGFPDFDGR